MIYAGIGARQTPVAIQQEMCRITAALAMLGHRLRSGGAQGADNACFVGAHGAKGGFEVFHAKHAESCPEWAAHASLFHPAWDSLSPYVKLLQARNSAIMLGSDLGTPVSFVLCWTPGGRIVGGTGQALRIAKAYGIPVFNMFDTSAVGQMWGHVANG
jgi:hypothetical protein